MSLNPACRSTSTVCSPNLGAARPTSAGVAREMVVETNHPTLGKLRTLGSPIKLSATPALVGRAAPRLGEHTVEVLREAGFSESEFVLLRRRGG